MNFFPVQLRTRHALLVIPVALIALALNLVIDAVIAGVVAYGAYKGYSLAR